MTLKKDLMLSLLRVNYIYGKKLLHLGLLQCHHDITAIVNQLFDFIKHLTIYLFLA